ncbi:MAG: DUF58 domain-containing protein [Dehalococcoidales bacterium]|jgi:uncharacterized protein (DUF58 family)|nr:DUF58 domain-containing protein [Dehalococcoidales bacterium]
MMKTQKILVIIPLALLTLALLLSSYLLLRLFFLSVLVLLISYLWISFGIRGVRVQFGHLPERSQVGTWFNEEITVFNNSRVPKLLLKLEKDTNLPGYNPLTILNLWPQKSLRWQTSVHCQSRGRYRLGSTTITVSDPFGFFWQNYRFGKPHHLLVFPSTLELPSFEVSDPSSRGNTAGGWLIGHNIPNAVSVREFTSGDSQTHVHWPSTARTGKLMVKVFEGTRSSDVSENVYIIADMDQAAHQGQGDEGTEEYTVTIAASLIKKYLDNGLHVGLISSSNPFFSFPPESGEEHFYRMLEALALVQANGKIPINYIIANKTKPIINNSTVIIISPATTPRLAETILQLKTRGILTAVVLLDPASFGGTTDPSNLAHNLKQMGTQTYIVRKGEELSRVLDRRTTSSSGRYIRA